MPATIVPFALVHNTFAGFRFSLTIDAGLEVVSLAVTGWILGMAATHPSADRAVDGLTH